MLIIKISYECRWGLTGFYPTFRCAHSFVRLLNGLNKIKQTIGQLHVRIQECIKELIAVTSRLDAVVPCVNVLDPMENY